MDTTNEKNLDSNKKKSKEDNCHNDKIDGRSFVFCSKCGKKNKRKAKYCIRCGNPLHKTSDDDNNSSIRNYNKKNNDSSINSEIQSLDEKNSNIRTAQKMEKYDFNGGKNEAEWRNIRGFYNQGPRPTPTIKVKKRNVFVISQDKRHLIKIKKIILILLIICAFLSGTFGKIQKTGNVTANFLQCIDIIFPDSSEQFEKLLDNIMNSNEFDESNEIEEFDEDLQNEWKSIKKYISNIFGSLKKITHLSAGEGYSLITDIRINVSVIKMTPAINQLFKELDNIEKEQDGDSDAWIRSLEAAGNMVKVELARDIIILVIWGVISVWAIYTVLKGNYTKRSHLPLYIMAAAYLIFDIFIIVRTEWVNSLSTNALEILLPKEDIGKACIVQYEFLFLPLLFTIGAIVVSRVFDYKYERLLTS